MVENRLICVYGAFIAGLSMYIFSIINGAESFMRYHDIASWIMGWLGCLIMESSVIYASIYHSSRVHDVQYANALNDSRCNKKFEFTKSV